MEVLAMNPRAIVTIARKDLLDAFKNKHVLFSLLLPIFMSLLMRLVYLGQEAKIKLAVFDPGSSSLITWLAEGDMNVELIPCNSPEEVRLKVEDGADAGIVLLEGFDTAVRQGEKPPVYVYLNARREEQVNWIEGFIRRSAYTLAGYELPIRLQVDWLSRSGEGIDIGEKISRFLLGMWLLMAAAMVGIIAVPSILVEEKEKHTLEAILIAPASYTDVVIAKGLVGLFYALVVSVIVLALNEGFKGNLILLFAAVLLTALFIIGVGILMSQFFDSVMQANTWSTVVFFPIIIPAMFFSYPPSFERIFRLIPTYYSVKAFQLAWTGGNIWPEASLCLGMLAASVLIILAVNAWVIRAQP